MSDFDFGRIINRFTEKKLFVQMGPFCFQKWLNSGATVIIFKNFPP